MGRYDKTPDPTPEQIAERAAKIRSKWSPWEESRRRCGQTHHGDATYGRRVSRRQLAEASADAASQFSDPEDDAPRRGPIDLVDDWSDSEFAPGLAD